MSTRPHGYARYKLDGCRCYVCGFAVAQYRDAREHAIRRGEWQPFVDAEPVRAHIRSLNACNMGSRRIAALSGVERKTVLSLLNGRPDRGTPPPTKVRPATAAAILAVQPTLDNLGAATVIDATGTRRRLQALVAGGWPQQHLAAAMGMTPSNFGLTLTAPAVIVRTARAVRHVYDTHWNADPTEHGATVGGVSRARGKAHNLRWAPVGAWDDESIDDPARFPDWTGRCGSPAGYRAHHRLKIPLCDPCREARAEQRRTTATGTEVAAA